ncbi:MAG: tetratricopeptide repeat protein [Gemmatimonadetes bacterium]|nr:tetratricopeptide repeat protein [Gemmatimonadota bacterium]
MALKGSLKEASLADVCQLLAMGQKTGCLSVTDRSRFGQIFFDRGRITYATIVNRRDRLGDLLLRDGLLVPDQLRAVLERQAHEPDRRLGEILVDQGVITSEQLQKYIRLQIEEAVYYLFTWSRGSFYFEVDQEPESSEVLLSINPESLLLEGARRVDEWSLIDKKIPSFDLIFAVDPQQVKAAGVELTQEQKKLMPLLDGSRTVQDLADHTGLGEFEVGKALYGLIQAGFAHQVGRRASASARSRESEAAEYRNLGVAFYRAGMLEDAERELRHALGLEPDDLPGRFHLTLLDLRAGRYREAVRGLKDLLMDGGPRYAAFVNLAHALGRLGRRADALLVLEEAETLQPGTPAVALARAELQLAGGELATATAQLADYRRRLGAETPCALYYDRAALAAALAGNPEQARSVLLEGLKTYPASAPLLLLAGTLAERQGDLDGAERFYRQAAEEDPNLAQAQKNLGDIAYRRGEHDEARDSYQRAIELAPELGDDVYAKMGNLYYRRQDREQALRCWRKALELNPNNEVVRNNVEVVSHAPA